MGVSIVCVIISLTAAVLYSLDTAGILNYCYNYGHKYMCYEVMVGDLTAPRYTTTSVAVSESLSFSSRR